CLRAAPVLASPSFPTRRSSDLSILTSLGYRVKRTPKLPAAAPAAEATAEAPALEEVLAENPASVDAAAETPVEAVAADTAPAETDRKSTRLNSSHVKISYAVFC